ncbi:MAG TPA: VOC family protein [Opitutaceae bacterium]|nr:VOC family protein [Opitutaceae bacterium]
MSIAIKELAFVFHPVTDVARARKFYEGFLGLKTGLQIEFQPGQWWIEYDIAGVALGISNAMPGSPASNVVLEVADLDASFAAAKKENIPIKHEIMEFPPCRMFIIKDPDGNEISLHQRKAK